MNIVLSGGTGFLGRSLMQALAAAGHNVTLLSRRPSSVDVSAWPSIRAVHWDGVSVAEWAAYVYGADVVINLAGEPLGEKRWSAVQKEKILRSRTEATNAIVTAIQRAQRKPALLVSGSAVGYYGDVPEGDVTETHKKGEGFLAEVCDQWEHAALRATPLGVRVVLLRTSLVLGHDGGALQRLALPFKLFAGGWLGSGKQWFPWIHRTDWVNSVLFILNHNAVEGPVNLAAPEGLTTRQFCESVGKVMRRPAWAPVPAAILKLALGEMADMVLTGQRVVPMKLLAHGFTFTFSTAEAALTDIFRKR